MEVSFIALETRERLFARERERQEFTFDDTLSRFRGNIYICLCLCVCCIEWKEFRRTCPIHAHAEILSEHIPTETTPWTINTLRPLIRNEA